MEEDTVELIDYLRVIWKRRILIIVITLVCLGIGVGVLVKNTRSEPQVVKEYSAKAVVKIGRKLLFTLSDGVSRQIDYIESPASLVVTLPQRHGFIKDGYKVENTPGYDLNVKRIGSTGMLTLKLTGPDAGVERVLEEIIGVLISEHSSKTEASIAAYISFIKKLEADANMYHENIAAAEASIREIKRRGAAHLEDMVVSEGKIKEEKSKGGQTAFMNMLYLKSVDLERDLRDSRKDLRNTEWQLILYQTSMERRKYDTEKVGAVKSTIAIPAGKKENNTILVAGVVGLMISLFIAFFMEYIEESKSRRKGK